MRLLRERVVQASSNEGDVVLDPFCGCGTTIAAAQKLNREWIGIDITHLAVGLMKLRLKDSFGMLPVGTKAPKSSPPYEGGVAPASGDGVVFTSSTDTIGADHSTKNHPVGEAPTSLVLAWQNAASAKAVAPGSDLGLSREWSKPVETGWE